jgi:hypothetical protein
MPMENKINSTKNLKHYLKSCFCFHTADLLYHFIPNSIKFHTITLTNALILKLYFLHTLCYNSDIQVFRPVFNELLNIIKTHIAPWGWSRQNETSLRYDKLCLKNIILILLHFLFNCVNCLSTHVKCIKFRQTRNELLSPSFLAFITFTSPLSFSITLMYHPSYWLL